MRKRLLSLLVMAVMAVGTTFAAYPAPDNGPKYADDVEQADLELTVRNDSIFKAMLADHQSDSAIGNVTWSDWEPFAPSGSNEATWTYSVWLSGTSKVKTYVRTCATDATKKQIKCEGWGAGVYSEKGVDILIDWSTRDNTVKLSLQTTGYYISSFKEDCALRSYSMGIYDPEQGRFYLYVAYSTQKYFAEGAAISYGAETLQMTGEFKDYSLHFTKGAVDDSTSPVKQTLHVVNGKDNTSFRVHVDTYENYSAAQSPTVFLTDMAKAAGEDYTGTSATVDLKGSALGIYVVVVSAYANGEMKTFDYAVYEEHPATEWETIGMRPYRDDIVTSLYNIGFTGSVYEVEIQKHKTYKDVYRIKNPYGHNTPFSQYTTFENAYIYLNAQNHDRVLPAYRYGEVELGLDVKGGAPVYLRWDNDEDFGTYDGYAISFPVAALVSNGYRVNTKGNFRAVINFRDPAVAFQHNAPSVLVGETINIVSENTFVTPKFESLTPDIATVDAKGVVTGVAPGTATIKVVQDAKLEFNAITTTVQITVLENEFAYANFTFDTDEGLSALGLATPAPSESVILGTTVLTSGVVEMSFTDGFKESQKARVYNSSGATDLRLYEAGGSLTVTVPDGYSIVQVDFAGKACNLIGEEAEFSTYTKTHSVWEAPLGAPISSKTFAASGTSRFSTIQVKVSRAADPSAIAAPAIVPAEATDVIYNLQGQQVNANYRGIVIVNGKKILQR